MKKIHNVTTNEFVRHEVELRHQNQIFYFYYFLSRSCVVTMLDEWLQPHSCIFILFYSNSSYANIITHPNAEYHVSKNIIRLMFLLMQMRFSARHSDAAKRITSCTTCDNKSRQKSLNPHSI